MVANTRRIRPEARLAAFGVEELLGPAASPEPAFHHQVFREPRVLSEPIKSIQKTGDHLIVDMQRVRRLHFARDRHG